MEKNINAQIDQLEEIMEIAQKCLKLTKNNLYFKYRALSPAIYRMPVNFVPGTGVFGTDARMIYADPVKVVLQFKASTASFARQYLHMLFHCIYLHPFLPEKNKDIWDLVLDICAEAAVMRLDPPEVEGDRERRDVIQKLSADGIKLFLPEPVCKALQDGDYDTESLSELFCVDQHIWRCLGYDQNGNQGNQGDQGDQDDQDDQNGQDDQDSSGNSGSQDDKNSKKNKNNGQNNQKSRSDDEQKRQEWADVSRQISTDMQSFHKQGSDAGNMSQEIDYLTRDRMDYEDFLRGFATIEEVMKLDMDEFDLNLYASSLTRDDGLLFIEPLEYKDDKVVRDFVIALDTSGSCSGELVQRFLNKTYSILKSTESFSSRVNIHIVQCDAQVQSDTKITSLECLESYLANLKLYGFGGTDFRPVFEYVGELINKKEFTNLGGLIYFTDGYGIFPKNPTPYKTAFVFLEDYMTKEVPSWAMSVYWDE